MDREEIALLGFSFLFSRQSWVRRCVASNHPANAIEKLRAERIDVALLDDRFGMTRLTQLLLDIAGLASDARPIIVASQPAIAAPDGVALVRRTWDARRIVSAVRNVADGTIGTQAPRTSPPPVRLTSREREVLALMARGKTNREIALRLCLSPHTIKQHTCSAYRKLHARNRAEAVTRAMTFGLIA